MIGSQKHAEVIAALPNYSDFDPDLDLHTPKGFTYLGSGCYRMAFLGPDGVVYKREFGKALCNRGEAQRYSEHNPEGFRFAACTLFGEVLAMEFVQDDSSDVTGSYEAMVEYMRSNLDYIDCAEYKRGQNWHAVNGLAVITDYSYGWE